MAMAGVLHLWDEWEIQILVLVSFALQVLLLSFAWMRWRTISMALWILLWLMYVLAEYTATYALGHMSLVGGKAGENQQLMAFWAPFLLMHLGGQDTITAYAREDSMIWQRYLVTLVAQSLGAGYVLYQHIGSGGPLVVPAVLMFVVGVLKIAERVWALSFSRLEMIRRYLDGVSINQDLRHHYPEAQCLLPRKVLVHHQVLPKATPPSDGDSDVRQLKSGPCWDFCLSLAGRLLVWWKPKKRPDLESKLLLDDESVLQGAHDLLYICMGQFVDDKILPSEFQMTAMEYFHGHRKTFQLVEMQLSLMYDILYTKAAVIHTWYGRCFRAISLLGTATAFFLFQFSTGSSKDGYNRVDATVTHILVAGALVMEAASVLRAMASTWTCALLREKREWGWLHNLHVSLRRYVRIAQARRWSDSIGQYNLLDSYSYTGDDETITSAAADDDDDAETSRCQESIAKYMRGCCRRLRGCGGLGSKIFSFWRDGRSMIPTGAKELVLEEIQRMVGECKGEEVVLMSYRGQCALKRLGDGGVISRILEDAVTGTNLDQSILVWHLATDRFLICSKSTLYDGEGEGGQAGQPSHSLVEATKAVSNYMMFLLVECPYMLPSPVRSILHLQARKVLRERNYRRWFIGIVRDRPLRYSAATIVESQVTDLAAKLADELLYLEQWKMSSVVLRMVFGVWVEMLCYAAHHCSRESHARQLNNGGEFLTTVWLLTTAEFNRVHYSRSNFMARRQGSIWNFFNFLDFADFMGPLDSCWSAFMSWSTSTLRSAFIQVILMIFSLIFLPIRGIIFLLRSPWRPQHDY